MPSFPHYKQLDAMDCGPTCLRMIAAHYGRELPLQRIRSMSKTTREGSSLLGLSTAAEDLGFHTAGVKLTWEQLRDEMPFPCIATSLEFRTLFTSCPKAL